MAVDKLPEFAKDGQKNTENLNQEEGFPVNLKPARQWFNFLFNKLTLSINQIIDENFIKHDELVDNLTTNDATKPLSAKQGKVLQDEKATKSQIDRYSQIPSATNIRSPDSTKYFFITSSDFGLWDDELQQSIPIPVIGGGTGNKTGNAASATKLLTARTVSFSGAATGSFSYNGSANSSCVLTLANSGVVAGSYASTIKIPQITVNAKGQLTAISQQDIRSASVTQSGVVLLADDLITDDATKALTAKQGKLLQDNKLTIGQFGVGATIANITITTGTLDTAPTQIGSWYETWDVIHWKNQDYNALNKPNWTQLMIGRNGSTGVLIRSSYDSVITHYNLYGEHNVVEVGNGFLKKLGTEDDKNIDANATSATKLKTARAIAISGAVSGSANFDGSGNIVISTSPNTDNLRVVNGSGYTIAFDDHRRIAIIQMTLWTNKTVPSQTLAEGGESNRHQIYSLPILLKARISADIILSEEGTSSTYVKEAFEWLSNIMQDGYRGYSANSNLFARFRRWSVGSNENVTAVATIVGIF